MHNLNRTRNYKVIQHFTPNTAVSSTPTLRTSGNTRRPNLCLLAPTYHDTCPSHRTHPQPSSDNCQTVNRKRHRNAEDSGPPSTTKTDYWLRETLRTNNTVSEKNCTLFYFFLGAQCVENGVSCSDCY